MCSSDLPELAEELEAKIMAALAEEAANPSKKKSALKSKTSAKDAEKKEEADNAEGAEAEDLEALDFDAELPDDDFSLEEDL